MTMVRPRKPLPELDAHGRLVVRVAPQPVPVRAPSARVRQWIGLGPVQRLRTGIPSLDKACRGGLPCPRLVVFGGAPGAGKTSLATWLGWQWAKQGVPVAMLAVDEGPEGAVMRMAQMEGFSVDRIEERNPDTLERLATKLDGLPMTIVDSEDPSGTVEGVAELLSRESGDQRVLIVDSIQTVRAEGTDGAQSPRERVDAVVRALKGVRDRHGFLILATCELARGAYRSRQVAETINDMAAFKESGGIEYAAQTALVLRSVPDEARLVDVTVPKNRALGREPFRLRMDAMTASYTEVDSGPVEAGRQLGPVKGEDLRDEVLALVRRARKPFRSKAEIRRVLQKRDDDVRAAVDLLEHEGRLAKVSGRYTTSIPTHPELIPELIPGED
jgi:KaiC/GvpD/RAD55 family RecA-like ATPase